MRFINELHEGDRLNGIYLCKQKQSAMTKNGKPYENLILQDKTGVLDGKIWDPNSLGIDDFDALDYIDVVGDVTTFAGAMQLNIKRVRKAQEGEYDPADYLPVSENSTDDMYGQLLAMIKSVKNEYLSALLNKLFVGSNPGVIRQLSIILQSFYCIQYRCTIGNFCFIGAGDIQTKMNGQILSSRGS